MMQSIGDNSNNGPCLVPGSPNKPPTVFVLSLFSLYFSIIYVFFNPVIRKNGKKQRNRDLTWLGNEHLRHSSVRCPENKKKKEGRLIFEQKMLHYKVKNGEIGFRRVIGRPPAVSHFRTETVNIPSRTD